MDGKITDRATAIAAALFNYVGFAGNFFLIIGMVASALRIRGQISISIAPEIRSNVSNVGLRSSCSTLLTILCESPARFATEFIERPKRSRSSRRRRTTNEPTISGRGVATPQKYTGKRLTWYVPIGTVERVNSDRVFLKRLGPDPHENGAQTPFLRGCPDIWELADGDFAVIGGDMSNAVATLPPSASCGPDERIVRIPRKTLVLAKPDIPDRL